MATLDNQVNDEDTSLTIELSASDVDGDDVSFTADVSNADLFESVASDGNILTLNPADNASGLSTINVFASDGNANILQEKANRIREAFVAYPAIAALKHYAAEFYGDTRWQTLRPPLVGLPENHGQQLLNDLQHLDLPMG